MSATPYKPVNFSSESLSQTKLQQLANNQQWLFENTPRVRYSASGLTRDSGTKILSGKINYGTSPGDAVEMLVYFGNFFTAGCNPNVVITVQTNGGWLRKFGTIRSLQGLAAPIDHTGFIVHVTTHERAVPANFEAGGWVHWQAVGY